MLQIDSYVQEKYPNFFWIRREAGKPYPPGHEAWIWGYNGGRDMAVILSVRFFEKEEQARAEISPWRHGRLSVDPLPDNIGDEGWKSKNGLMFRKGRMVIGLRGKDDAIVEEWAKWVLMIYSRNAERPDERRPTMIDPDIALNVLPQPSIAVMGKIARAAQDDGVAWTLRKESEIGGPTRSWWGNASNHVEVTVAAFVTENLARTDMKAYKYARSPITYPDFAFGDEAQHNPNGGLIIFRHGNYVAHVKGWNREQTEVWARRVLRVFEKASEEREEGEKIVLE